MCLYLCSLCVYLCVPHARLCCVRVVFVRVQFNVAFELVASTTTECPDVAAGTAPTALDANVSAPHAVNATSTASTIANLSTTWSSASNTSSLAQECENQVGVECACVQASQVSMGVVHTVVVRVATGTDLSTNFAEGAVYRGDLLPGFLLARDVCQAHCLRLLL